MEQTNWKSDINYDSVHCIGNGKIYAYSRGPEIFDMGGPYYSSPAFATMELSRQTRDSISSAGTREAGTGIWTHKLFENGKNTGRIVDYTTVDSPVYIRELLSFAAGNNMEWEIKNILKYKMRALSSKFIPDADYVFLTKLPPGTLFYKHSEEENYANGYPVTDNIAFIIAIKGGASVSAQDNKICLSAVNGDCKIVFSAGKNEAQAIENCAKAFEKSNILDECRSFWKEFTAQREKNRPAASFVNNPLAKKTEEAADDIAVLIKCQQGDDGGIMAGYNYHLSYVRDNYGTHRGLLAMGCYGEDKKLLEYYAGVYNKYGRIHNAQGIGCHAFHIHENDYTEITGYIVLMGMEYFAKTGDENTLKDMLPLMKWCMDMQKNELKNGALSFNGDETYVAGGVIPRTTLIEGSMEATLLYYKAGELLLPWLEKNNFACIDWVAGQKEAMNEIKENFAANFIENGVLYCNKPDYYTYENAPSQRHGVRECGHGFGCSFKTENMRYVCPDCYGKDNIPKAKSVRYELISAGLMPSWINCDIIPAKIINNMLDKIVGNWKNKKILPSRPEGGGTVGYDYGLSIFALAGFDAETANDLANAALEIRDETGAWVEYYQDGKAMSTKCRPWESGVNIAALISLTAKN